MRTYGRTLNPYPPSGVQNTQQLQYGNYTWQEVQSDSSGFDDYVYITALIQCFRLNLGESPFWANFGIPAKDSLIQQSQPDYFVLFIQNYFAPFFASLIISKLPQPPNDPTPRYNVSIVRLNGSLFQTEIGL